MFEEAVIDTVIGFELPPQPASNTLRPKPTDNHPYQDDLRPDIKTPNYQQLNLRESLDSTLSTGNAPFSPFVFQCPVAS